MNFENIRRKFGFFFGSLLLNYMFLLHSPLVSSLQSKNASSLCCFLVLEQLLVELFHPKFCFFSFGKILFSVFSFSSSLIHFKLWVKKGLIWCFLTEVLKIWGSKIFFYLLSYWEDGLDPLGFLFYLKQMNFLKIFFVDLYPGVQII